MIKFWNFDMVVDAERTHKSSLISTLPKSWTPQWYWTNIYCNNSSPAIHHVLRTPGVFSMTEFLKLRPRKRCYLFNFSRALKIIVNSNWLNCDYVIIMAQIYFFYKKLPDFWVKCPRYRGASLHRMDRYGGMMGKLR